jgi:GntR family transcriptional regulator
MSETDRPGARAEQLDRAAPAPLWRQLLTDLRARLASGEFAVEFPGELDLVEQYGVSRHTVREALRQLRIDGTISTGRGRRPRLAAEPVIAAPTGVAYSLFSAVESEGLPQVSVVRTLDVRADGVVAARLGLEESTPLVHLERLRLAGGAPLALDRVWLPASIGEPLLTVDFRRTGLYDQLAATGIHITGGEETVRAVVPSPAEHEALGLTPPAAVFSVFRTGTSAGVPVEWRHTLIRADRFALTGALAAPPSGQGAGAGDIAPLALLPDIR